MINSNQFLNNCHELGYNIFTGTPCSYMSNLINHIIESSYVKFIEAPNEGDAVALASGLYLSGKKSIVIFQNSGLGNAVNPITSLSQVFKIPFIGIVSLRGEGQDEPQHQLMGKITSSLLELMGIPWEYLDPDDKISNQQLIRADQLANNSKTPYFFIVRKNTFCVEDTKISSKFNLKYNNKLTKFINYLDIKKTTQTKLTRYNALCLIKELSNDNDLLISTTGKTSRELYTISDDDNNFYMVGSMGCALSLGLGLNYGLNQSLNLENNINDKIFIIDGDGALLMRMGNMALAGYVNPKNLVHILLDNGTHDSTGGQRTYSEQIDFCKIAKGCGYQFIYQVDNSQDLVTVFEQLKHYTALSFIRVIIEPGSIDKLGRPSISPEQVANRFKNHIKKIISQ